jgi:geranylgeranyl reductase family protein
MSYDVIIVGAGPAGSAAAYHLARAGRRVLLMDQHDFPREKVCGDCVTPRGMREIDRMGAGNEVRDAGHVISGCTIHSSRGGSAITAFPEVDGYPVDGVVVERRILDEILKERAVAAGAEFLPRARVHGVLTHLDRVSGVTYTGPGGEAIAHARIVIAADGSHSRLAKRVFGLDRRDVRAVGVAFRVYYEGVDDLDAHMEIYGDDSILPGVGWMFPMGSGRANVGVGIYVSDFKHRGLDTHHLLASLTEGSPLARAKLAGARPSGPVRGAKLLMGGYPRRVVKPGMLLAGDAAGLVNPLTGEGMMFALESGREAARAAAASLADRRGDEPAMAPLMSYQRYVDRVFGRYFSLGTRFIEIAKKSSSVNAGLSMISRNPALARLNLRFWISMF